MRMVLVQLFIALTLTTDDGDGDDTDIKQVCQTIVEMLVGFYDPSQLTLEQISQIPFDYIR